MSPQSTLPILTLALAAGAALAHSGVQNEAVRARMHAMHTIGENAKLLGTMYKDQTAFDAARARAAAQEIAAEAARIPALFAAPETDPISEALPAIWQQFDDFAAKARGLQAAAEAAARGIDDSDGLRSALIELADACRACHLAYRQVAQPQ